MPSLRDLQEGFAAALSVQQADTAALEARIVHHDLPPARRLGVYRNNMRASLSRALAVAYPAVAALVGEAFFYLLARRYIDRSPSRSGNLHDFGANFPALIDGSKEARILPWLADVARLEWACQVVYHAADRPPLAATDLTAVETASYGDIRLELHPASALVASPYSVTALREFALRGGDGAPSVDPVAPAERLLVARRALEIEFQHLDRAAFVFVAGIARGDTLENCAAGALEADPAFDVTACLAQQFARRNIVGYRVDPTGRGDDHRNHPKETTT